MKIIDISSLERLLLKLKLWNISFFDSKEVFDLIDNHIEFNNDPMRIVYTKALYLNSVYLMLFNTGYDQDFICNTFNCDYDQDSKVYEQLKALHNLIHELK
mgnify:CR=1 FL=1